MSRSTLNYVNIKIDVSLHLFMKAIMASSMTIFGPGRWLGSHWSCQWQACKFSGCHLIWLTHFCSRYCLTAKGTLCIKSTVTLLYTVITIANCLLHYFFWHPLQLYQINPCHCPLQGLHHCLGPVHHHLFFHIKLLFHPGSLKPLHSWCNALKTSQPS